jgi:predicted RNA-binding Zn-ribbon protein involved in translation (DUF1610 family)
MKSLRFKCPACKGERLEEIMDNVTLSTPVTGVFDEGGTVTLDYGDAYTEYSDAVRFQCADCGHVLTDADGNPIKTVEGLAEWLKTHP